jgi:SAM-dependent methyltransferase
MGDPGGSRFDAYADRYDALMERTLGSFGRDVDYYAAYKIRTLAKTVRPPVSSILEFGCGVGRNLVHLRRRFPDGDLYGCDVSRESLRAAESRCPAARLFPAEPDEFLPFRNRFDLILAACVFHHITGDGERRAALGAIKSMLSGRGTLFLFDHNPLNPLVVRSVRKTPWDDDAVLLKRGTMCRLLTESGFRVRRSRYVLFFPAALQRFAGLDPLFSRLPLGAQYLIEASRREP